MTPAPDSRRKLDARRVLRLVVDQFTGERSGRIDRGDERIVTVRKPRFLAGVASHREQGCRQLRRRGCNACEQRACAFARRLLLLPRFLECIDERTEVFVDTFQIRVDRVLRDVGFDRERTGFERERHQQGQGRQRENECDDCTLHWPTDLRNRVHQH